jgi:hypothetical protein
MLNLNEVTYELLMSQIQDLLNEKFTRQLELGKYSKWALNLTQFEIVPMLAAIGQYGKLSAPFPDINTEPMFSGQGLDQILDIKFFLIQEQLNALSFLASFCRDRLDRSRSKFATPFEYSKESPRFAENVAWAIKLTRRDLFGILWHVGGFSTRNYYRENLENCINDYHPRVQECLTCLMRVAQGQPTYYQLGGERYSLREHQQKLLHNSLIK